MDEEEVEYFDAILDRYIKWIRKAHEENPKATPQEIASQFIDEKQVGRHNAHLGVLADGPLPKDEFERQCYDALFSRATVKKLVVWDEVIPPGQTQRLLEHVFSRPIHLEVLLLKVSQMSTEELSNVLTLIHGTSNAEAPTFRFELNLSFHKSKWTKGMVSALSRFFQQSMELKSLRIRTLPVDDFDLFCDGIGNSQSLEIIKSWIDCQYAFSHVDVSLFAKSLIKYPSFKLLEGTSHTTGMMEEALLQTEQVKSMDLLFQNVPTSFDRSTSYHLTLHRQNPWKRLLSMNVPLEEWSVLLKMADEWWADGWVDSLQSIFVKRSHSNHDALFLLIREKHDVLLQNIRRNVRRRRR